MENTTDDLRALSASDLFSLFVVEWVDSLQPVPSWRMMDDLPKLETANCNSVGWLVGEDASAIMLAPNVADLGTETAQGSGFMRIPKACITKARQLSWENAMALVTASKKGTQS
jgi:hypothetical protein